MQKSVVNKFLYKGYSDYLSFPYIHHKKRNLNTIERAIDALSLMNLSFGSFIAKLFIEYGWRSSKHQNRKKKKKKG